MRNRVLVVFTAVFCILCLHSSCFAWEDASGRLFTSKAVLLSAGSIYAASGSNVFKKDAGGEEWQNILSVRGSSPRDVNLLIADDSFLYALTDNGLFCSHNQGRDWRKIFKGKSYLERQCVSLAVLPYGMYLGTKEGLSLSRDNGRSWRKEAGRLGNARILSIAYHPKQKNCLYLVSNEGVFRTADSGRLWERIFVSGSRENPDIAEEDVDEQGEAIVSEAKYIAVDSNNPGYIYLSTSSGVYKSENRGADWALVPDYGLLSRNAGFLLISADSEIYAVFESGIFRYNGVRWQELSLDLFADTVYSLALDKQGWLYAACGQGLFKLRLASIEKRASEGDVNAVFRYSQGEPGIREVQEAAVKYAEVSPKKILDWRKRASVKALLPEVAVGVDRNVTDLWHWEGGSTTRNYDDLLIKGKDIIEWDLTVSWDFSELIWNNDQTSIDARSRLLVQLRDDILDEVTKLYFQRLRVKMEMDELGIEERNKRVKKQLQIEELTASLDALTGGYFSEQCH